MLDKRPLVALDVVVNIDLCKQHALHESSPNLDAVKNLETLSDDRHSLFHLTLSAGNKKITLRSTASPTEINFVSFQIISLDKSHFQLLVELVTTTFICEMRVTIEILLHI